MKSNYEDTYLRIVNNALRRRRNSRTSVVQHNYHDHSFEDERRFKEKILAAEQVPAPALFPGQSQTTNTSKKQGGVTVPFPTKLFDLLEHIDLEEPYLTRIVSWQPHGRCFLVHDTREFEDQVLSKFFRQNKYASFQRQLNLYGFNRITKGPDRGAYYHELFLRGKKFLSEGIQRNKIKGTGKRMKSNPDAEPNFYRMAPLGPSRAQQKKGSISNLGPMRPVIPSSTAIFSSRHGNNFGNISRPALDQQHQSQNQPPMPALRRPTIDGEELLSLLSSEPLDQQELEDIDFVFDGMPFHVVKTNENTRRHSLMEVDTSLWKQLMRNGDQPSRRSSRSVKV